MVDVLGWIGAERGMVGVGNRDELDVDLYVGRFLGRRQGAQARDREEAAGDVSGYERDSEGGRWLFFRSLNMPGKWRGFRLYCPRYQDKERIHLVSSA